MFLSFIFCRLPVMFILPIDVPSKSAVRSAIRCPPRISETFVKVLLSETQIGEGVERMAREIKAAYAGRPLTIVGVLTGSVVLLADLIRRLDMPVRIGVIHAS